MRQPGDIATRVLIKAAQRTLLTLPRKVGVVAVNFTNERFKQQNWVDHVSKPWQKRKPGSRRNAGRAILTDTGRLRRGNRIMRTTSNSVTVGNKVPYANAHNAGFKGPVKTRRGVRNMNLPKRQFMGKSAQLDRQITRMIQAEMNKVLKL